jgi:hypothetical protein
MEIGGEGGIARRFLRCAVPLRSKAGARHPASPAQREKGPLDLLLFRFAPAPGPTGSLRSLKIAPGDFVEPKGSHVILQPL